VLDSTRYILCGSNKEVGNVGRKRRTFSAAFKRGVVEELLSGETTAAALCRRYEVSPNSLVAWKKAYEDGRLEDMPSEDTEALKARIRELERLLGRQTLEMEFLKKTAAIARRERNGRPSIVSGAISASGKRAR
jgi:transposase